MKVSLNYRENPRRRGQYEAREIKLDDGRAAYETDDQSFNDRPRGRGGGYNRRGGGRGGRRGDGRSRGRGRNRERDYNRGSGREPNANGWISTDVIKTPKWGSESSNRGGGSNWLPKPGNRSEPGPSGDHRPPEQERYSNEGPYSNPYQSNQGSYDSNPNPYQSNQNSYQPNPYQAPSGPPGPYQPEQNSYQNYQQQGGYQQGAYPASGTNTY